MGLLLKSLKSSAQVQGRRFVFTIISALVICFNSYSQTVEVDLLTGSPIVAVPLYSINYGKISVPIGIQYGKGAFSVMEGEGDAGLGWNLSCVAGVYRQVRGLPDEYTSTSNSLKGRLFNGNAAAVDGFTPANNDSFTNPTGETADYNFITGRGYVNDTEPDLYTVSAPGLYFQFVLDGAGLPKLLSYVDVKITQGTNSFTVQNNTGATYSFATTETVTRQSYQWNKVTPDMFTTEYNYYYNNPVSFIQAWNLTSITDSEGNQVLYTYTTLPQAIGGNDFKTRIKSTNIPDTLYRLTDKFTPNYVAAITGGNYKVSFTWNANNVVQSIKVEDLGLADVQKYTFSYQVAKSSTDTKQPYLYKSFLAQIQPVVQCVSQPPYKFSYQGLTMNQYFDKVSIEIPWKSRLNQDAFGYYNGVSTNKNVPTVYFYSALTDSRRFSLKTIPGATLTQTLTGANRNVISTKVGMGSLVEVKYPTGGTTKIIYERTKYLDSNTGQVSFGPSQRVASLISNGGEVSFNRNASSANSYHLIRKNYSYSKSDTDTTSSGVLVYPAVYAFSTGTQLIRTPYNMGYSAPVLYTRVKEMIPGQGAKVYEYAIPGAYPTTSVSTDWVASKSRITRNPSNRLTLTNVKNGYYTFPFAPNPNYDFERGLLTRQSEYSQTGVLVREKKLQYTRINPALQTIYGLRFEKLSECDCFHFSKYSVITGTTKVLTKELVKEVSESSSSDTLKTITYYHYNSDIANNNFLMDSVRTVMGDGSVMRTKIKYVKDFATITTPVTTDIMANAIKLLIAANRHGEVVEQFSSIKRGTSAEIITGGSLLLFKNYGSGKILPYKTFNLPQVTSFTPAAVVTGSTQGFSYNGANYLLSQSFDEYDGSGRPASVSDDKKNKTAYHNAVGYSVAPVAVFSNVKARSTVYDGFEFSTGRSLTNTSGPVYGAGWTGQRSVTLPLNYKLYHSSLKNAGEPYRVSCWAKASTNANITVKLLDSTNVATVVATLTLPYTSPNQWIYLEGFLPVASLTPTTLSLEVNADANISIDDVIVMPQSATVSTQTFLPLKGATSQTDDRGNSTKVVYDGLGRKINVFDRKRNLIELDEYQYKDVSKEVIEASFSLPNQTFYSGVSFTATSSVNSCTPSVSYQWTVNGVIVGSGAHLTYAFATSGMHVIELKVTNTVSLNYVIVPPRNVCVYPSSPTISFNFSVNNTVSTTCDSPQIFSITNLTITGCSDGITYLWSVSFDGGASWECPIEPSCISNTNSFAYAQARAYIMNVTISTGCNKPDVLCPASAVSASSTQSIPITFTPMPICP